MEFFIRWFSLQLAFAVLAISAGAVCICIEKMYRGDFKEKEERKKK